MRWFALGALAILAGFFFLGTNDLALTNDDLLTRLAEVIAPLPPLPHYQEIHALYLTASTARSPMAEGIIKLIKKTQAGAESSLALNALVIDVQDSQGNFLLDADLKTLVRRLRFLKIFPIARLVVFQNNQYAKALPDQALNFTSYEDVKLYQDEGGRYWLDPANQENWEYIWDLARQIAEAGFGEINLDYVRYPEQGQRQVIEDFSRWLREKLKTEFPEVQLTADVFGYTFLRERDIGVGQDVGELAKIFDFIYPMTYPSHYSAGNFGFDNPAEHPYEVVYKTLEARPDIKNIRIWVQDFHLGADYTPEMVRQQMKAAEDFSARGGVASPSQFYGWLIWNPRNQYRKEIFGL